MNYHQLSLEHDRLEDYHLPFEMLTFLLEAISFELPRPDAQLVSQMLNVWCIYLHLGSFGGLHVGKYTIH